MENHFLLESAAEREASAGWDLNGLMLPATVRCEL